jgi:hypothetical protein
MMTLVGHRILPQASAAPFGPDRSNVTSLQRLRELLEENRAERIVLTFDDGYMDNRAFLLPVLEQFGARAIVFVTTGFIDRSVVPFEYCLAQALSRNRPLLLPDAGELPGCEVQQKIAAYNSARSHFAALPAAGRERFVAEFNRINGVDTDSVRSLFLSWDDVRELADHPLITIGSHALTHTPLTGMPLAAAYREMRQSRRLLEEYIGRPVRHLAYPYGSGNRRTDILALAAGYRQVYSVSRVSPFPWVYLRKELR